MLHPHPALETVLMTASLPLPWSQAHRAIQGSLQALETQDGLSLLQDLVAQQAPWNHSCQAHQACRISPSLLPGPSVLQVLDHPTRTASHRLALSSVITMSQQCLLSQAPAPPSGQWPQHHSSPCLTVPRTGLPEDLSHGGAPY
jgi:hypothetical protein